MPKRKDLEAGYYHLRTQEAYIQVNYLIRKRRPRGRWFKKRTHDVELYLKVKDLVYNRLVTDLPDDQHAARMRLFMLQSATGKAAAFGKAAYLPTLTTSFFLG